MVPKKFIAKPNECSWLPESSIGPSVLSPQPPRLLMAAASTLPGDRLTQVAAKSARTTNSRIHFIVCLLF